MAAEQSITQTVVQAVIKVTEVAIIAERETDNQVNNARPVHTAHQVAQHSKN